MGAPRSAPPRHRHGLTLPLARGTMPLCLDSSFRPRKSPCKRSHDPGYGRLSSKLGHLRRSDPDSGWTALAGAAENAASDGRCVPAGRQARVNIDPHRGCKGGVSTQGGTGEVPAGRGDRCDPLARRVTAAGQGDHGSAKTLSSGRRAACLGGPRLANRALGPRGPGARKQRRATSVPRPDWRARKQRSYVTRRL